MMKALIQNQDQNRPIDQIMNDNAATYDDATEIQQLVYKIHLSL